MAGLQLEHKQNRWQPKPGDRVFRPRRIPSLGRVLSLPGLFSAGYGNVGSSIYYALGIVAMSALGATPLVLAIAGVLYVFNVLTYTEGTALLPDAGGPASLARYSFNNTIGFITGWAIALSYVITISISACSIPPYLSYFWPSFALPPVNTVVSILVVLLLIVLTTLNIRGCMKLGIYLVALDIITKVALVLTGIMVILVPGPGIILQHMFGKGNWPSGDSLVFGIAIATLAFTGVETISQLSEETPNPQKRVPQAYLMTIGVVLTLFAGVSIVAVAAMTPQVLADPVGGWAREPLAGIAASFPFPVLRECFRSLVAVTAVLTLLVAAGTGLIGISRLSFNLASCGQLPSIMARVHVRYQTPCVPIVVFGLVAALMLVPGFFLPHLFAYLGTLYVFGSLLVFSITHAAILWLRIKEPGLQRPFMLGWNVWLCGGFLPVTAILGLVGTFSLWLVIVVTQPYGRWAGLGWMAIGIIVYYLYRLYRWIRSTRR